MTTEDKLFLLRLIKGMQDTPHKHKIFEKLQKSKMNLKTSITFLQLEFIKDKKRLSRDLQHNQVCNQMQILWQGT